MTDVNDRRFDELAQRLTDPSTPLPLPVEIATGDRAAARGAAIMRREYGSQEALDTVLRTAGRPRLGSVPKGKSPVVRGSIAQADHDRFEHLMRQTGKKESELVREAVRLLLEQHHIAS